MGSKKPRLDETRYDQASTGRPGHYMHRPRGVTLLVTGDALVTTSPIPCPVLGALVPLRTKAWQTAWNDNQFHYPIQGLEMVRHLRPGCAARVTQHPTTQLNGDREDHRHLSLGGPIPRGPLNEGRRGALKLPQPRSKGRKWFAAPYPTKRRG